MSSDVPNELKYTKTHEWVALEKDGHAKIGITQHAQSMMGDIVYISLPEVGSKLKAGKECAVVESVKAAADIYSPTTGTVVEVNEALRDTPELVNKDPYGKGWIYRLQLDDKGAAEELLAAKAYQHQIEEGSE